MWIWKFIHSKPAGKKKERKGPALYTTSWKHHSPIREKLTDQATYIHRTVVIQKKYEQLFNFIYLITGLLRKLWYRMKKLLVKLMEK